MSAHTHTPGPWHVVMSDNATPIINHEHGFDWTDPQGLDSRVCAMPAEIMQSYNSLPNARLIAAAPDLLRALEWMVQRADEGGYPDGRCLAEARAAIAKATGEHQ